MWGGGGEGVCAQTNQLPAHDDKKTKLDTTNSTHIKGSNTTLVHIRACGLSRSAMEITTNT